MIKGRFCKCKIIAGSGKLCIFQRTELNIESIIFNVVNGKRKIDKNRMKKSNSNFSLSTLALSWKMKRDDSQTVLNNVVCTLINEMSAKGIIGS